MRYRIAYSSASVAGVQAAVKSGLAVAVLGHSMIPEGTRMLALRDGFASLPGSNVVLRQRQRAAAQPVAGMAAAIRDAFRAVRPRSLFRVCRHRRLAPAKVQSATVQVGP